MRRKNNTGPVAYRYTNARVCVNNTQMPYINCDSVQIKKKNSGAFLKFDLIVRLYLYPLDLCASNLHPCIWEFISAGCKNSPSPPPLFLPVYATITHTTSAFHFLNLFLSLLLLYYTLANSTVCAT